MSSAYWRMLTLLREPENWYPRSILIEMVPTSVFIIMTTDRGSHTLSSSQFVTTPSPLSLSSRRSPYLLCERSHRERDDTHRTFFLTLGSANIGLPSPQKYTRGFPFPLLRSHSFVRRVSRSCSCVSRISRSPFHVLHSPFRVLHFSSNFFSVRGIRRETVAFDWKNTGDYGSVADYRHYSAPPTFFGRGLFLLEIYRGRDGYC